MATTDEAAGTFGSTFLDDALAGVVEEASRRLAQLGWPVRVEIDPFGTRSVLVRHERRSAAGGEETLRVPVTSSDADEAVAELLTTIRRRGWDSQELATLRIARSPVWCEPP